MKRREFIATVVGAAGAATLPLPAFGTDRILQTFRKLRASREGLQPDIAVDRMTRTISDLRAAGIELVKATGDRPPAGFVFERRCSLHEEALAGLPNRRKLRCLICETEELPKEWIRFPFLMRGGFFRVA